ncbi:MAG: hypothetical protein MJY99_00920 [Fibrobacter sp.]|uniref:hypothetical protein n=1 Tax=Fibrobacter sp. TaxID=35828 RepID=UPI00388CF1ED|nr:hypothetical protein [Fibrobacter sp.]
MEIVLKITLVASIILMGYNISEFVSSYKTVCEKTDEFKKMAMENEAKEAELRRSNFLLSFLLSSIFIGLTHFSGLALWITAVVAVKLFFTLFCSDSLLVQILRSNKVSRKFYLLSKVDALVNAFLGLVIALVLVL